MTKEQDIGFRLMVRSLAKPGDLIIEELNHMSAHLLHMAVGVSGEAGELLDAMKKHSIYNKPLDLENVIEELGDLEFYMEGLRQSLNITREEVMEANMNKLAKRYPNHRYNNEHAQERADKNE